METLPFIPLELVAIDPVRNICRRWSVAAYRDLLGAWVIETRWGRVGSNGRCLVRSFDDEDAAQGYMRALLARRAGAVQRIGIAYRVASSTPRYVDSSTS
ncbi:WGR domain-containing protein [Sphingomonas melonis]|uniref:WGR domain-containing protein n=1 Tax=Sphingomonas melonis TaxID=152682 RepID=UPI001C8B2A99|nr:WGR domain-containing protein [Sphingomonas melonis]MBX8846617.1 WGR domain-containing protein [Sphingomonas melonis]MBX8855794.1 WGR domain-containing protein [Sphingomonas melonis]MBX8900853.1 WGR domain-containing protein [Sphingomonas melonis]